MLEFDLDTYVDQLSTDAKTVDTSDISVPLAMAAAGYEDFMDIYSVSGGFGFEVTGIEMNGIVNGEDSTAYDWDDMDFEPDSRRHTRLELNIPSSFLEEDRGDIWERDPSFEDTPLNTVEDMLNYDSIDRGPSAALQSYRQNMNVDQLRTPLNEIEQEDFNKWVDYMKSNGHIHKEDQFSDYDMQGYWRDNIKYTDEQDWAVANSDTHFPDTYKLPNHETFSTFSKYAQGEHRKYAGTWNGDQYILPTSAYNSNFIKNNAPATEDLSIWTNISGTGKSEDYIYGGEYDVN